MKAVKREGTEMVLNCGRSCVHWCTWGCGHPQGPVLVEAEGGLRCVMDRPVEVPEIFRRAFRDADDANTVG